MDLETLKDWSHSVRHFEIINSLKLSKIDLGNKKVLEIGSGNGYQLNILKKISKEAKGIDIQNSLYANKITDIIEYDGKAIPFEDSSFDVIFSSNVLEHIKQFESFQDEIKRVLKKDGFCIHILPSHSWRIWTSILHYPSIFFLILNITTKKFLNIFKKQRLSVTSPNEVYTSRKINMLNALLLLLYSPRHGERGNFISEIVYFHPNSWKKRFEKNGWIIESFFPTGLFYWSRDIFKLSISLEARNCLHKYLGSACYTYITRL